MSKQSSVAVQCKVTVTLPEELLARLDARVPSRRRSHFIAAAIEAQLALAEQEAALEAAAGTWTDRNHPDMMSETDIDAWLRDLRHAWVGGNGG